MYFSLLSQQPSEAGTIIYLAFFFFLSERWDNWDLESLSTLSQGQRVSKMWSWDFKLRALILESEPLRFTEPMPTALDM